MAISVFKPGGGASDFEFPATDGTSGQALVTNGAGALSFATMSLPDGAIIGGVMYFNRPTKPTVRQAGVPLVIGDRWYKTDNQTEWSWNGTYWLGEQLEISHPQLTNITTSSNAFYGTINTVGSVLVDRVVCYTLVSNTNDTNNYWTLDVALTAVQQTGTTIASFSTANDTVDFRLGKQAVVNYVYNSNFPNHQSGATLRLTWTKTGSPGLFYAGVSLRYRHIAP